MLTVTATFDLIILYFVAANVICVLCYVLLIKHRARVIQRNRTFVSTTIANYFRESGIDVAVECIGRPGGGQFVALVSSKPSKRFRHSMILEIVLKTRVREVCGLDLEKVYWCFPIKTKEEAVERDVAPADAATPAGGNDAYLEEGVRNLEKLPRYPVRELSREKYDEFVRRQSSIPDAAPRLASVK